ncbi:hypothetical protein L6J37_05190 [Photobacterium sp. WH77]|uniref:hypothetical protein n=1 Tax=unclassified Photobacterium TaxID=2628852 RepID=UPI001EDA5F82|nr:MULTISPECIES: hypothetical protein [unclassified Photobacterium]MCG2836255.1 hypothetical protein [Photobacterium sp. WH77]MCG2843608.1 hypothetical protein [Photobacterium sp. WH80]
MQKRFLSQGLEVSAIGLSYTGMSEFYLPQRASITLTSDDLNPQQQATGDFQPTGDRYSFEGLKGVNS